MRALRAEKTVSLDEQVRRKQRDEEEAKHKARELASGHATPEADPAAKTVQKINDDAKDRASGSGKVDHTAIAKAGAEAGAAKDGATATAPAKDATKDAVTQDDGLQPDERSIQNDLNREKAAKEKRDVILDEAAHIVADEIDLIRTDTKLAAQVLPRGAIVPVEVN